MRADRSSDLCRWPLFSLIEQHWALQECQSCQGTVLQLSQSFWWQKAHRACQLKGGRVGSSMWWKEEYQGVSKLPGLILWCIKRYGTSANHTVNTTVWVLRLLCAVQRGRCWRSCPGLQRRGRRRSGRRESRCGWCTATQSDSSWCREPQPRCGRRRCKQTGSPRAEQQGYQRQQTRCGSTSTLTQWRWCSWVSTPHPGCVYHQALRWHPQTPPNRKFKRGFH